MLILEYIFLSLYFFSNFCLSLFYFSFKISFSLIIRLFYILLVAEYLRKF
jgi:uncharacterized membrane protein YagU involved in acid resistance